MSRSKNRKRAYWNSLNRGPSRRLHRHRSDYKHEPSASMRPVTHSDIAPVIKKLQRIVDEPTLPIGRATDRHGNVTLLPAAHHKQAARKRRARRQLRNLKQVTGAVYEHLLS